MKKKRGECDEDRRSTAVVIQSLRSILGAVGVPAAEQRQKTQRKRRRSNTSSLNTLTLAHHYMFVPNTDAVQPCMYSCERVFTLAHVYTHTHARITLLALPRRQIRAPTHAHSELDSTMQRGLYTRFVSLFSRLSHYRSFAPLRLRPSYSLRRSRSLRSVFVARARRIRFPVSLVIAAFQRSLSFVFLSPAPSFGTRCTYFKGKHTARKISGMLGKQGTFYKTVRQRRNVNFPFKLLSFLTFRRPYFFFLYQSVSLAHLSFYYLFRLSALLQSFCRFPTLTLFFSFFLSVFFARFSFVYIFSLNFLFFLHYYYYSVIWFVSGLFFFFASRGEDFNDSNCFYLSAVRRFDDCLKRAGFLHFGDFGALNR